MRTGTPTGVVNKLARDIAKVMATPDLRNWLAEYGADPMTMSQPEFARFVLSESERAARIAKAAGINSMRGHNRGWMSGKMCVAQNTNAAIHRGRRIGVRGAHGK